MFIKNPIYLRVENLIQSFRLKLLSLCLALKKSKIARVMKYQKVIYYKYNLKGMMGKPV